MISILSKKRRHVIHFMLILAASLCSVSQAYIRYEAEGAELDGIELPAEFTLEGYSGTGYVLMNGGGGAGMIFTIEAPAAGYYELIIRYLIPTNWSDKQNNIVVNGNIVAAPYFTMTDEWANWTIETSLLESENIVEIRENWGNMYVDYIELSTEGPSQAKAAQPQPENHADYLLKDVILSWTPGMFAASHDVYFGTDFNDVNNGTADVLLSEAQDVNYCNPGPLEFGTTYYWRIDEVNAPPHLTIYKGDIWSFSTEPVGYQLPSARIINVTASSYVSDSEPNYTIDGSGLGIEKPDKHSTEDATMWLSNSCNPGEAWIQFEFDVPYKMHKMLVWNFNGVTPLNNFGFKDVNVQYSEDGQKWDELADVPEFNEALGANDYKYNTTVDFDGLVVKYVKLTANSNWGSIIYDQYGLSEVRFLYIPMRAREPYPDTNTDNVPIDVTLSWQAGREAELHNILLSTDQQAISDGNVAPITIEQINYTPLPLDLGSIYYWRIDEVGDSATWTGDLWSFRTEECIIVEDFEFYDDDEPNRIWDAWADGWDDDNNGSTIGYPDPDFDNDEHFVETNIVYSGEQSGPLLYNNTAPVDYSETVLVLDSTQDWTTNAAEEVVLHFRGNAVTFYESNDGYIAMSGEGADIWGNDDEFRYAYKTLNGNGSMIVRLDSLEKLNNNTNAGIMIREIPEDPNSVMALVAMRSSGDTALQWRTVRSGYVYQSEAGTDERIADFPVWLKLTREGDTITGQRSFDGVIWEPIGEDPNTATTTIVSMSNQVYIGLFVCSHTEDTLSGATFYGLETTGNVTGDWTVAAVGDTEQAEGQNTIDKLYMALEDNNGNRWDVNAPVMTAVGWGDWYQWIIPQSEFISAGVNMTRIKKIIVGIGDINNPMHGKGMIFIDDIGYGRKIVEP